MKTYKNFERYIPESPLFPGIENILHLKDENGLDWYELQKEFSWDTLKVVYDREGIIRSCSTDVSALFPVGMCVSEVDISKAPSVANMCLGDWVYKDGRIVARLSDPFVYAEERRQGLLAEASAAIADWRTELQLNVITDEDKASLIKWMAYIKSLKALDLSTVSNEAGYQTIKWPDKPTA